MLELLLLIMIGPRPGNMKTAETGRQIPSVLNKDTSSSNTQMQDKSVKHLPCKK
jgi:hypothetical protein